MGECRVNVNMCKNILAEKMKVSIGDSFYKYFLYKKLGIFYKLTYFEKKNK